MPSKKKRLSAFLRPSLVTLDLYGIWSILEKKIIFIGLNVEDVEFEYDIEQYCSKTHVIVCLKTVYDVSNLELLNQ